MIRCNQLETSGAQKNSKIGLWKEKVQEEFYSDLVEMNCFINGFYLELFAKQKKTKHQLKVIYGFH